ncbi:putative zinc protease [Abditibacteriota bacterium]|nr:putative zinc protease [Abditibacteriota bacterium]
MKFLLSTVLFATLLGASSVHAAQTQKHLLPNGLTVLVREDHSAPVVTVRFYVKTGSIYEDKYLGAGLSHLFEHTLFEGTTDRTGPQIDDELQAIGGVSNAYTSYDVTCYHVTTATPYFGRALAVLTDMMRRANFPEERVKQEQGVIHNEMNIGEDDPDRAVEELWDVTAFQAHPARYPVIGYQEQFDRLTRDDILSYYRDHYTPENTILSIAGDVTDAQVMEGVQKELADWERGAAHTPPLASEPRQIAPRRADQTKQIGATYLQIGWHTIPLQNADLYALDMLSQILGGGETGRLVRELRDRTGLVSDISVASYTPNFDAGTFSVSAELEPKNQAKVEAAVMREIARTRTQLVTADELKRAKTAMRAAYIFGKQGVENQAEGAAYDEMGTGNPDFSASYVDRIQQVTPAQILAVAQKYLSPQSVTIASVHPPVAPANIVKPVTVAPALPATMTTLPNGVRLIIKRTTSAPTVAITVAGLGGVRLENSAKAGVAGVAADLLTRGTQRRTADQINDTVENLGGSLSGFSGYNSWGIESNWLSSDWRKGMSLVAESVLTPTFPDAELRNIKAQTLSEIATQDDNPAAAAGRLLRRLYFGSHPYARAANGSAATIKSLSHADVEAYWNSVLQPDSTVVSIVGNINPTEVQNVARYLFGSFKAKAPAPKAPPVTTAPPTFTSRAIQQKGVVQSAMFFGFPGITVKNDDRFALDVLDAALSGASLPGGRIFGRLREEQLVYDANAYDAPGIESGMFVVYAASTPQNRPRARQVIEEELQKARESGFTPEEMERAKTMCIASHAIELQTGDQQARDFASAELLDLGYQDSESYAAKIQAVTNDEVQRVARKYLDRNHSALAIVEPAK